MLAPPVALLQSVIEVATFRSEGEYLDGRRPSSVRFTSAEQDARRRDFTINGIFLDPLTGRFIDHVGGQEDLKAKRLRAIGEPADRFREDHLRLLRAIRFAARFDLQIEPLTADAMRLHAPSLRRISPERIAEELRLMLTPPTRGKAWRLLWDYALVDEIFRFLASAEDVAFDPGRSIFLALAPAEPVDFGLALSAATWDFDRQARRADPASLQLPDSTKAQRMNLAMRQALRISNEESDQLQDTLLGVWALLSDGPPTLAGKMRFLARPCARGSMQLLEALRRIGYRAEEISALLAELAQLALTPFAPPPLINGDDLTAAGLRPGPAFRKILDGVYDAQLEKRIETREQALDLAMKLANK